VDGGKLRAGVEQQADPGLTLGHRLSSIVICQFRPG
jgi:hypothetical protein